MITDGFHFNTPQRKAMLFRFSVERKQTLSSVFAQWSGVFTHDLIDYTPPRAGKETKNNWPDQKKAGERAVDRDVRKVFRTGQQLIEMLEKNRAVSSNPKLMEWIKSKVASNNVTDLSRVLSKIGIKINLIPQPTKELHFAERRSKGRVRNPKNRYFVLGGDSRISGYAQIPKKDVGKLKSGWLTAANQTGLPVRDVPMWVKSHSEPGIGRANFRGPNFYFNIINKAPSAKDQNRAYIVGHATMIIEKKMAKSLAAITHGWRSKYGSRHP